MATDVDKAEAQMNLTALQQFDPYISHILLKASQVALYLFNHAANEWEKTEIQGTMFVYERSASPYHGFMIMNRLSLHNWTEPITHDLDFTLQEPFLLYKTSKAICGIWFYYRDDCIRFAKLIERLMHKTKQESKSAPQAAAPAKEAEGGGGGGGARAGGGAGVGGVGGAGGGGGIDIMSMLNKAQNEYKQQGMKKKRSESESGPSPIGAGGDTGGAMGVIRPIPVKVTVSPGHTSKTDEHLPSNQGGAKPKTSPMGPRFQRSVSMQETRTTAVVSASSGTGQGDGSQVIPVLHRLMSQGGEERTPQPALRGKGGQVHTLESLEKLHTSSSAGDPPSNTKKSGVQSLESIERQHLPRGVGGGGAGGGPTPTAAAAGTTGAPSNAESSQHLQRLLLRLQSGTDPGPAAQSGTAAPAAAGPSTVAALASGGESEPQEAPSEKKPPSPMVVQGGGDMNQALLEKLKSGSAPGGTAGLLTPAGASLTPSILASQVVGGTAEQPKGPPAMKQLFASPRESRKTPSPPNTIGGIPSTLLTPELLRARSASESVPPSSTLLSPLKLSGTAQGGQGQAVGPRIDPLLPQGGGTSPPVLTKEQLASTLIHLLKTDEDFVTKIHSAYSQSHQRLPP